MRAGLSLALGLATIVALASDTAPTPLVNELSDARLAGSAHFTFWGFDVYDARLWIGPGFRVSSVEQHPFGLELQYRRGFTAASIADRSLQEMHKLGNISAPQAEQWRQALRNCFPDVRPGDRILGVNRPGSGAAFYTNGRLTGEIRDVSFARLFFGIWLSPQTTEPRLRSDLLAGAAP